MIRLILACTLAAIGIGAAPPPEPEIVRVRLVTAAGPIVLALDARRAPLTVANFMAYVDDGRLDGTSFYRASRSKSQPGRGFIQGGIDTNARRMLGPFPLEPTSKTGLRHSDGAVSMARGDRTDSATANFSLLSGPNPALDARPGYPGYAAFGRIESGMAVVQRILAMPTSPGGDGAFKGQMLVRRVAIVRAERLNGTPKPTGKPKPWKLFE